jgi:hypothetical protein
MLKQLLGLATGGGWIPLAVVFVLGLSAGGGATWWIQSTRIDGYQLQVTAAEDRFNTMQANRDALSHDNDRLAGVVERQQREADAAADRAKATLERQQAGAADVRLQLRDARDQTASLIQKIQDAHHAQPIHVSEIMVDDFHPLIRFGLERLLCAQRAGYRGEAADGCRVPLPNAAGDAGAAGGSAGAGDYRPGFDAQLRMLNDLWRLHNWGASCYADKRAIADSQLIAP